ncbi:LOB domain-containing protein 1-like [Typha latifolia]|uniref:LOB domain-containing protein 1-like n=1 Tax=Typha latifolia TaxID=4733 RepID=UPI003C2CDC9A
MDSSDTTTTTAFRHHSLSLSSSSSSAATTSSFPPIPPTSPAVVLSPCAACKILRRRCTEKCVLAPYFPPTEPLKFTTAHRVFGASNIIKFLQELPESQRADAVSSMVYEANARVRDPVYGCAGVVFQLQKQVSELQVQLARAQAELINMCMGMDMDMAQLQKQRSNALQPLNAFSIASPHAYQGDPFFFADDGGHNSIWEEPLWT